MCMKGPKFVINYGATVLHNLCVVCYLNMHHMFFKSLSNLEVLIFLHVEICKIFGHMRHICIFV